MLDEYTENQERRGGERRSPHGNRAADDRIIGAFQQKEFEAEPIEWRLILGKQIQSVENQLRSFNDCSRRSIRFIWFALIDTSLS